ncbi:hypothetical protein JCM8547_006031 [Rhodosporidiobolus lusitaniae]
MAFRPSIRRLAAEIASATGSPCAGSGGPAAELLPPLPLYRRLLRVHRKVLPHELRVMGDDYVKAEFRRTRTADNPLHIVGFLGEWKKYLDFHESQLPHLQDTEALMAEEQAEEVKLRKEQERWERARLGEKLDEGLLEALSADQIGQLYELFTSTKDVWASPEEVKAKMEAEGSEWAAIEGVPRGEELPNLEMAARELQKRNAGGEGSEK